MAIDKKTQTGMNTAASILPVAGTAIGSIWGPAGAAIGSSAGGMAGGILSTISSMLGETPKTQGPTGAQRSAESAALLNVSKLQSQSGLTSAELNRIYELTGQQDLAQLQLINALNQVQNMSPLAKESITEQILKETTRRQVDTEKQLANLDLQAEREREQALTGAIASASEIASNVQTAIARKEYLDDMWEQTKWENFNKNISGIADTGSALAEYMTENKNLKWSWKSDPEKERKLGLDKEVAKSSGIASTNDQDKANSIINSGGTTVTTRAGGNTEESQFKFNQYAEVYNWIDSFDDYFVEQEETTKAWSE